jgi:hypothetical protein
VISSATCRLLTVCAISGTLAAPSAASAASRFFHSPSGNIECQLNTGTGGAFALCETIRPARRAVLHANGTTTVCRGAGCLSNGPEDAFTLRYGRSTALGGFRCVSMRTGMRCVSPRNHGFTISRAGLTRF